MKESNENIKNFFDSLAPNWDNDQDRLEYKYSLIDSLGLKEGNHVLDLACGTGVITNKIQTITKSQVIGLDLSESMIEIARRKCSNPNIVFKSGDFYEFKETGFDYVIMLNAYPHFMDLDGLKEKFIEVLKERGRVAIIHACGREELNSHHQAHALHVSRILKNVHEEASFYEDSFKIIRQEEDKKHFLLILEKR